MVAGSEPIIRWTSKRSFAMSPTFEVGWLGSAVAPALVSGRDRFEGVA
jgi:hypothetical protein